MAVQIDRLEKSVRSIEESNQATRRDMRITMLTTIGSLVAAAILHYAGMAK